MPPTPSFGAFVNCPGAINIFTRPQWADLFFYLGTAVTSVEPEAEFAWINVMNDLGGRSVPFQIAYDGEEHVLIFTLNRYDSTVLAYLRSPSGSFQVTGTSTPLTGVGQDGAYSRGTLGIGSRDFETIILPQYTATPAFNGLLPVAPDFPKGRRYFSCVVEKYKESTVGTRVEEVPLIIRTHNVFVPPPLATYTETDGAGFALFTENPAALGPLAPTS